MLDIDTAIKHCLEVAEKEEQFCVQDDRSCLFQKSHAECAADHRQLAEWLMELKDLRAEQNDQYAFIDELMSELKEAKRLLKAAVEDMNSNNICFDINACNVCTENKKCPCDTFKWRYTDEALKLIGGETDEKPRQIHTQSQ